MTDPRLERLAQLVVGYSLDLQAGKIVRIDSSPTGLPLATELYAAALQAGAFPYVNVDLESVTELLVAQGSEEQISNENRFRASADATRSSRSGPRETRAR